MTATTQGFDMKIINLSNFPLASRHIQLLQRGMSFSPVNVMDEFNVYKDVTLFLRKVYLRYLHTRRETPGCGEAADEEKDKEAL